MFFPHPEHKRHRRLDALSRCPTLMSRLLSLYSLTSINEPAIQTVVYACAGGVSTVDGVRLLYLNNLPQAGRFCVDDSFFNQRRDVVTLVPQIAELKVYRLLLHASFTTFNIGVRSSRSGVSAITYLTPSDLRMPGGTSSFGISIRRESAITYF